MDNQTADAVPEETIGAPAGISRTGDYETIPRGWKIFRLGDIAYIKTGNRNNQDKVEDGQYPFFVRSDVIERIDTYSHECEAIIIPGEGGIGSIFHYINGRFELHQRAYKISDFRSDMYGKFIYYTMIQHFGIHAMKHTVKATVDSLRLPTFNIFHFLAPQSKFEQCIIAEALSDVDGLLESLEVLIVKKQAIKQAAMQQLLTGKIRLPGFSEEWQTITLGEISDIKNGSTPNTQIATYWNGQIPWCTPTDITDTTGKCLFATARYITEEGLTSCAANLLPAGTLLLCSRATIGEIKIAASQICTNQGFKSLVCKDGVSNEFLYYLLITLKPKLIERAIGSTFLEIGKREVASLEVNLPPLEEQRALAAVLSDIDAEIATLERRRDKTRVLKQGMMQQLLTGRTRLPTPE